LALLEINDGLGAGVADAVASLGGKRCLMRAHEQVCGGVEGVVDRQRLDMIGVYGCPGNAMSVQARGQISFVY
jgi:hypothetical protein